MVATVHGRCGRRLAPDRCGIEQSFRADQGHAARTLGKPLVPADAGAEDAELGAPDPESGIAWGEVEFLLIARAVRNMRLAITAHHRSVRVDHRQRVEMGMTRLLEETYRQNDTEGFRQVGHLRDQLVAFEGCGQREMIRGLVLAEIRRFEQFLDENGVGAFCRRLTHQSLGLFDIRTPVPAAGKLRCGERDLSHSGSCCVMQWMPPPPSTMSSAWICRMSRPGKQAATISRAFSSLRSSKPGMTTPPLAR